MSVFIYMGVLLLGNVTAVLIGRTASILFHLKFSLYSVTIVSEMYVRIMAELVAGCVITGIIFIRYFELGWIGALTGFLFYATLMLISDIKSYNNLTNALKILNIETDEDFNRVING